MTLSLKTAYDVQSELKVVLRNRRRKNGMTVEALSERSGVPYGTIRKFERNGNISLRQFLMLVEALGDLDLLRSLTQPETTPSSIEEVLKNA
ncbi:helix-turn-helix domain-containing protein [Idiomarina seosinensis]|uniref:helix-turn-helix domain-containing protein n=1 Tax=Idiomarina seosinensis TaxID=281739 RepID=UPI00384EB908